MTDFMGQYGFEFVFFQGLDQCIVDDDAPETAEAGEIGVGMTAAAAAVHYEDSPVGEIAAFRQSRKPVFERAVGEGFEFDVNGAGEIVAAVDGGAEVDAAAFTVVTHPEITGHLLGAAGGVEAAITALAIHEDEVPPTINQTTPDPDWDLDSAPNESRKMPVRVAMSNSFGFGGTNATLVLRKHEQ